jgi:hypothetical protein
VSKGERKQLISVLLYVVAIGLAGLSLLIMLIVQLFLGGERTVVSLDSAQRGLGLALLCWLGVIVSYVAAFILDGKAGGSRD